MLDFKDVVFQFPVEEKPIIDHLSFHVDRGEFISIIGASGCGKSTIFRLINRLLVPEKGEILVAGRRVAGKPAADSGKEKSPEKPRDKTRGNIPVCGYMPQQDLLFPWRTVEENICLPMELQGAISREEQHRRAQKALKDVGLAGKGDKRPSELSGGMRQRLGIAQALINRPAVLVLDEPTAGLDPRERVRFRNLIKEVGMTSIVLFSTHIVSDVESISDDCLLLKDGRLIDKGSPDELCAKIEGKVWDIPMTEKQAESIVITISGIRASCLPFSNPVALPISGPAAKGTAPHRRFAPSFANPSMVHSELPWIPFVPA